MKFKDYMYELIEEEINKNLAYGKKVHCRAHIKKRIIQTVIVGAFFALFFISALTEPTSNTLFFLSFLVLAFYFILLYATPLMSTILNICEKEENVPISEIVEREMFQ